MAYLQVSETPVCFVTLVLVGFLTRNTDLWVVLNDIYISQLVHNQRSIFFLICLTRNTFQTKLQVLMS